MTQSNSFAALLEERLERAQAVRAGRERDDEQLMHELKEAHERIAETAADLHVRVIRPILEEVARRFPNASLEHYRTLRGFVSECRLAHTDRFPATAKCSFAVAWDATARHMWLLYLADIVPLLLTLDDSDRREIPLSPPETAELRAWVEQKALAFVDTYLQIETSPHYQRDSLRADPVCGMEVPTWGASHTCELEGQTYVFCSALCLEQFLANPSLYLKGRVSMTDQERPHG